MATAIKGNSMKSDLELKAMFDKLDLVTTARTFKRWRASFLQKFESFLDQEGMNHAQNSHDAFSESMNTFVKLVAQVECFVEIGDLTMERYFGAVKARNCLNEMAKMMSRAIAELDSLIPQTTAKEKICGYTKFHMGAVLIRNDFAEYGRLCACRDILLHMRTESLNEICDKQVLEGMDSFGLTLQKFCDVMADLGLYEVMLKCIEFDKLETSLDDIIFLDVKTGGIGELRRDDCVAKSALTKIGEDENKNDRFREACDDQEGKDKIYKILKESRALGLGCGISTNAFEDEGNDKFGEAERVKNLWGVQLKKTSKDPQGEELVFVDKRTGAFGQLSRRRCIESSLINEIDTVLVEAEADFEDRADLVEDVRRLLSLGTASTVS